MNLARASAPLPAIPAPSPLPPARRAARLLGLVARHLAGGGALLVLAATAYTIKRRLGIDIVPGVDMLPDERIEAAIAGVVRGVTGLAGL